MHEQNYDPTTAGTYAGTTSSGSTSTASQTAKQATESAKQTATEVAGTAKEQGQRVASEVGTQARSVVADVRQSVTGQVRTGHNKLADGLRAFSDEIGGMAGESGTPANRVAQQVSQTGRRAADYLQDRGPEGLLEDVQGFARRKPGTFLLAMAAAGFVVGRLGKSTAKAAKADHDNSPTGGTATGVYAGGYDTAGAYGTGATYAATGYEPAPTYETTGTTYASSTVTDPYAAGSYDPTVAGSTPDYDEAGYPVDPVGTPDRGLAR